MGCLQVVVNCYFMVGGVGRKLRFYGLININNKFSQKFRFYWFKALNKYVVRKSFVLFFFWRVGLNVLILVVFFIVGEGISLIWFSQFLFFKGIRCSNFVVQKKFFLKIYSIKVLNERMNYYDINCLYFMVFYRF